ncbi:Hypothetical protein HDN1F_15350 [gamma proteobacterium HdN1]|nr:Hypothetical protein HDN1F_15350 [gamma proteobacterium HdN1]
MCVRFEICFCENLRYYSARIATRAKTADIRCFHLPSLSEMILSPTKTVMENALFAARSSIIRGRLHLKNKT